MVFSKSAAAPVAVFCPRLFEHKRSRAETVLKLPSVLLKSEYQPTAVFAEPVVRLKSAFCPSAVLNLG